MQGEVGDIYALRVTALEAALAYYGDTGPGDEDVVTTAQRFLNFLLGDTHGKAPANADA